MCHLFVLQRPVEETQKRRQTEPVHVINPGQIHDHKIHLTGRLSQRQVSVPLLETERDRCYAGAIWCLFTPHVTHSFSSSPGRAMSVIGETRSVIGGSGHCWLSSGSATRSTPCSPEYSLELWPESTHTPGRTSYYTNTACIPISRGPVSDQSILGILMQRYRWHPCIAQREMTVHSGIQYL